MSLIPQLPPRQRTKADTKYWFHNDPVKTLHANALTASIPSGERFFVSAVLPYLGCLKGNPQKRQVIQFLRQELNHSRAHYRLYLKTVKPHYPKLRVKRTGYQLLFLSLAFCLPPTWRLAIVAAMEHFTAVTSALYLREPERLEGATDAIRSLWEWHFTEELEHQAVAFDLFQARNGSYGVRFLGFWIAAFFLAWGFCTYYCHMAFYDKLYRKWSFYKETYRFFLGTQGLLRLLARPYLRYLSPRFHPSS